MIEVRNLSKVYGQQVAVADLSLALRPGEILGLLGPNGAGKTTTLRTIAALVRPGGGSVNVDGLNVATNARAVQRRLGVMPDAKGLYKQLTARENISYFARLQGMPSCDIETRVAELSETLDMGAILDRRADGFSQGECSKVALARALVHRPAYVLLDEPTNGLDVPTTRALRRMLLRLRDEGRGIIFSSHVMHEVEQVCDRAVVVTAGRVVAEGSLAGLRRRSGARTTEEAFVRLAYDQEAPGG